jgi:putative transposase
MIRSYKFRLYPTKQQVMIFNDTIETCRKLYNDSLSERSNTEVGYWDQMYLLPSRKKDNKYYKQVHSQVLQDVLLRLDKTYQAFFKKITKYPKYKRRGKYNSFAYPQRGGFKLSESKLMLSCIGAIKIKMHRIPVGTLKRCTVIRDVDQWYCCITADDTIEKSVTSYDTTMPIGIDVGLHNWLALSDGRKIQNMSDLADQAKKVRRLQKCLSKKQKHSKNREKVRIQLAKAWQKVRRSRDDFLHKTSKALADEEYTLVVFEKLSIANMVKNHSLAQAIMDATWAKLRQMTAYKVEQRGGQIILVNPSGTSQKCSRCGVVAEEKLDLSVRTFECHS